MTVHAGYDQIGGSCLGHSQPGTAALAEAIRAKWGSTSDGIYNCRNVRGGSSLSAHAEGRAYDHHWTNEASGFQIANALVALNAELGIQVVIFWDRIWSYPHADEGFRPYHGADPHHSHIHVEQNWSGATELSLPEANRVLNPTAVPEATGDPIPFHQEDDMLIIYADESDAATHDGTQVLADGTGYVKLTTQKAAEDATAAGAKYVHVPADRLAAIENKAI